MPPSGARRSSTPLDRRAASSSSCKGAPRRIYSQPVSGSYLSGPPMSEVTHILSAIEQGDPQAAQQLLPLVYDELRKRAAVQMAGEKPGQTLDATGLVHEAYMRLVGDQHFENRRHFFAAAAEAMRCILVDRARRKRSRKRGGGRTRVPLDET